MYPQKGTIAVGVDADLVVVDLNQDKEVTVEALHSAQDYTPFEGMVLKGWPETTLVRGQVVFDRGEVVGRPGMGRYVRRPAGL
jgi:dihydropyrimidinase